MSKTFRVNGKIVNDITLESYKPDLGKYKNYDNNDKFGLLSSPIYSQFEDDINLSPYQDKKLFTFQDYGYVQVVGTFKKIGFILEGILRIEDENGNKVGISVGITDGQSLKDFSSAVAELWEFVKPGYTCWYRSLSAANTSINVFYRMHNTSLDDESENSIKTIKHNGYITNSANIKEYKNDEWETHSSNKENTIQSSIETFAIKDTDWSFILQKDIIYEYKKDGYTEVHFLALILMVEIYLRFDLQILDENNNVIYDIKREIQHYKLTPETAPTATGFLAHKVKKGWKLRMRGTGVREGTKMYIQIFNYPSYIEIDDNGNPIKVEEKQKTLMYNDKVVNEVNIEEYDTINQKWKPIELKNINNLETAPIVYYKKTNSFWISEGYAIPIKYNGILTAKLSTNQLTEVFARIGIGIWRDGHPIKSTQAGIEITGIRPEFTEDSIAWLTNVQEGDELRFFGTGLKTISNILMFFKIDRTHRLVDNNGNPIE